MFASNATYGGTASQFAGHGSYMAECVRDARRARRANEREGRMPWGDDATRDWIEFEFARESERESESESARERGKRTRRT